MKNCIIRNNIISGNKEDGIQLIDYQGTSSRTFYIENNIISGTGMAAIGFMSDGITVEDYRAASFGSNNIYSDPLFADSGSGDYHLKSQAGRFESLSEEWIYDAATSSCIDAGDLASPIGCEQFANGGRVNIGSFGGTVQESKSYFSQANCETIIAGDINGDCVVALADLAILTFHWLEDYRQ